MSVDRFVGFVSGYTASMATTRGRTTTFTAPNQSCASTWDSYTPTSKIWSEAGILVNLG